jgi:hypothetical protein
LSRGEQVPILAGTKVIGRQSDYNIGLLDVQTRRLEDQSLGGQNLLAARVSRNLFKQSWIGAILTNGNPAGTGRNTLVGADARFATSAFRGGKNLNVSLFFQRRSRTGRGLRGRREHRVPERPVGSVGRLEADRQPLRARTRLRSAHRHSQDRHARGVRAASAALGHPSVLLRVQSAARHHPRQPRGELDDRGVAVRLQHRVG